MAWPPTRQDLERARSELRTEVEDDPWWSPLEQLGRTHRWLDERDEAARRFREAAADVQDALREHGREDTLQIAQVGSLLWRAGDAAAARPWLERALRSETSRGGAAALHYLADEHDRAAALGAKPPGIPTTARTPGPRRSRCSRSPAATARVTAPRGRGRPSPASSGRTAPAVGGVRLVEPLAVRWFEEAALVEAWLHERRQPDHAELLGLL